MCACVLAAYLVKQTRHMYNLDAAFTTRWKKSRPCCAAAAVRKVQKKSARKRPRTALGWAPAAAALCVARAMQTVAVNSDLQFAAELTLCASHFHFSVGCRHIRGLQVIGDVLVSKRMFL
jgi:hypothetical protein